MAKTAAERQAAYRAKRAQTGGIERRLNAWISSEAYLALEALALRYGVTRRGVVEMLLLGEADQPAHLKSGEGFAADLAALSKTSALPRNDLPAITLPAIEELNSKKLLRNRAKRGANRDNKQSPSIEEPKPSQLTDAQYAFEL